MQLTAIPRVVALVGCAALALTACSGGGETGQSSPASSPPSAGSTGTSRSPDTQRVTERHLDLELHDRAERALLDAGVQASAHGPASRPSSDELRFPITGGRIAYDPLAGTVDTKGSGTLAASGARVRLSKLAVDLDQKVLRADVDGKTQAVGTLDLSHPEVEHTGSPVADVDDVDVTLKPSFVRALNDKLDTSVPATGLRAELELHVSTR